MFAFLLGAAAGYVLGARAGRQRYEQIVKAYHQVIDHPAVRGAAGGAVAKVTELVRQRRGGGQRSDAAQSGWTPLSEPRHDEIPRA